VGNMPDVPRNKMFFYSRPDYMKILSVARPQAESRSR
jgi:hypothetical protein